MYIKKLLSLALAALMLVCLFVSCQGSLPKEMPEDFSFSIRWGVFGESSYDSSTGKLVKARMSTEPEKYITTYFLSDEEKQAVYDIIKEMKFEKFNKFGKFDFVFSDPHFRLSLTVKTADMDKTVVAENVAYKPSDLSSSANSLRGKRYLKGIEKITDILVSTEEWKALPDYEFQYD